MKNVDPSVLREHTTESGGADSVEKARQMVNQQREEANREEHEADELQQMLMEMQLEKQREEAGTREKKETERQIEGIAER